MRLIDADALYNGTMKQEYFDYVERNNHGRESFAYSCAMQRLADAPTIDAIPVGWLIDRANDPERAPLYRRYAQMLYEEWHKEQEAQD